MARLLLILIIITVPFAASAQEQQQFITLVPDTSFIPSFTADGTAHRISYAKLLNENSVAGSLGGVFPAAFVRINDYECLISVGSSVYTTLRSAGVKYDVTNADFYVDLLFDFPFTDNSVVRFGAGHTSHHLVDDGIAIVGASNDINYARDYYQFFYIHRFPALGGFLYAGSYYSYSFLINTSVNAQFLWQAGVDAGSIPLFDPVSLYAAIDVKVRGEVNYASTQSYQIGIRASKDSYRAIRFAYTYRTGIEERGQFYNQYIYQHSLGLFFDF